MTLSIKEYDKVVRKFVDDYVNNLTPHQLREIVSEQSHIDFENIRQDTGIDSVFEEMESWDSELFESISKEFDFDDGNDGESYALTFDEEIALRDSALGVWEADNEDDLIEEITAAAGWCIKSIDYDIQLK